MNNYYIKTENNKEAIFDKNNPNKPISKWWYTIYSNGLVEGKSEYYMVQREKDGKVAIFHKNNPNEPITNWWDEIYDDEKEGLLSGKGFYYFAVRYKKKNMSPLIEIAKFHKNDPNNPVSNWKNIRENKHI